ncbi:RidA family protein [Pseudoroseomonas cervicalis]|uniref:RidA family protein n=1 Tax=Teichococcus cervicalis TaxID=204525 RepID=UPI002787C66C|nr:RidA family protein [Pseudoroseomonas cervicalis]MDQ1077650.1 enamine deaminase RidA (YjgF/YER057c/UK114 family) [Pseudoroseomonas cervicalis]
MAGITRLDQNARRSRAVIHNGTVYLAGHTADDRSADVAGQTRQVLAKIDEMLAAAGSGREKLLSITIWLADMADFAAMNEVYDAWVVQGHTPARCCGEVKLALPDIRVEIMAIAAL